MGSEKIGIFFNQDDLVILLIFPPCDLSIYFPDRFFLTWARKEGNGMYIVHDIA